ncbi:16S rRNA pseudouridine(516) synthase [Virgibacillus phasianinus]|uniref:Pseudouridine synthase n=1 Tax=Virgibacillus phasianinus TaxID=2017483 RepID=A0A220U4Z9_9BACI|nr:pseudouridine synthase [Virgibacillus phasianinus]ASK62911.1 16S rRNA pseudouridine(516) synthase [Virgibacillus phasianinus]
MRLDKLLANTGHGSRKEVKNLLKRKKVSVNRTIVRDGSLHVDPSTDIIQVGDYTVHYQEFIYLMMNKPPGYVSATVDDKDKTVIDLLAENYQHFEPFPVGRLDKDTEGLLLLTNDGELGHKLTSPKKDIEKVYYARIDGCVTNEDVKQFAGGILLEDGYQTKSAKLRILTAGAVSEIEVTISEGKYHQVKRMFAAVGKRVSYLKRIKMGQLLLDPTLDNGYYRELTEKELTSIL